MVDEKPKSLKFHYIKSPMFRVVHVDGLFGGVTPTAFIHFALYSERMPIPQQTEQVVNADGTLGPEVPEGRVVRDGVVRELEVDAIMNIDVARSMRDWLTGQLELHDQLVTAPKAGSGQK